MKPVSLADITYAQGLQLLAVRKQAMDQGKIRRMTPEALANTLPLRDVGQRFAEKSASMAADHGLKYGNDGIMSHLQKGWETAKSYLPQDAAARHALYTGLAGAGLGTAVGLGQAAMSEDKDYLNKALRGGLAGGAMGGGLGLALNPGVAKQLYDRGRSLLPSGEKEELPEKHKRPAVTPEELESAQQNYARANSSAPLAGAVAETAAWGAPLGYTARKVLKKDFYQPAQAADLLHQNLEEIAKGSTTKQRAASNLLTGSPDAAGVQFLGGKTTAPAANMSQDAVREAFTKQKANKPSLIFGKVNPATVRDLATATGKSEDDILRAIMAKKGNSRQRLLGALIGIGLVGAGSVYSNYAHNVSEQEKSKGALYQLLTRLIDNKSAQPAGQ